jgi:hypothetical protein
VGVGTVISGLRPAPLTSMLLAGIVPSVNSASVIVLDPGSIESVLLMEELATGAVGAGQKPDTADVPNEDVIGNGPTEITGEDVDPGSAVVLLDPTTVVVGVLVMMGVETLVVELVIPFVGHSVIAPRDVPGIGPRFPKMSWMAPNELAVAPTVGIVPGGAVGDDIGMTVDEVVGLADARRVVADPTCATADPQPTKTTADIVSKRFINVSLIAVETLDYF